MKYNVTKGRVVQKDEAVTIAAYHAISSCVHLTPETEAAIDRMLQDRFPVTVDLNRVEDISVEADEDHDFGPAFDELEGPLAADLVSIEGEAEFLLCHSA